MTNYRKRLLISEFGNAVDRFSTRSGLLVATGYTRIIIGGRGPYIEFSDDQIHKNSIYIPDKEKWRLSSNVAFYHEWRTTQDYVKFYYQVQTVDYADYRIGFWYASPFDLLCNDKPAINPFNKYKEIKFEQSNCVRH